MYLLGTLCLLCCKFCWNQELKSLMVQNTGPDALTEGLPLVSQVSLQVDAGTHSGIPALKGKQQSIYPYVYPK